MGKVNTWKQDVWEDNHIKSLGHCLPGRRKASHKNGLLMTRGNIHGAMSATFRQLASISQSESGGIIIKSESE